jgi:hypothetical protein
MKGAVHYWISGYASCARTNGIMEMLQMLLEDIKKNIQI